MKRITIEELQKDVAGLLSDIEKGETLIIVREGQAIAEVSPVVASQDTASWKQPGPELDIGVEASKLILEERESEGIL